MLTSGFIGDAWILLGFRLLKMLFWSSLVKIQAHTDNVVGKGRQNPGASQSRLGEPLF